MHTPAAKPACPQNPGNLDPAARHSSLPPNVDTALHVDTALCTKVSSLHLIHCIFARRSACYLVASLLFMEGSFIIGSVSWRPRRAPETSCILEPREHLHCALKFRAHSHLMRVLSCLTPAHLVFETILCCHCTDSMKIDSNFV